MQLSPTFWLLVLAIIVVFVYTITPRISSGGGDYKSRLTAALADIRGGIKIALDNYKTDNGVYPKSFNGLIQRTDEARIWHGPYLDALPVDPWGNRYVYALPGKHNPGSYDLLSVGPDGKEGTDDDIGNW